MTTPLMRQLEAENALLEAENRALRERARKAEAALADLKSAIREKAKRPRDL